MLERPQGLSRLSHARFLALPLLLAIAACGSGGNASERAAAPNLDRDFTAEFSPGPIVFAVEVELVLEAAEPVESVAFTVHSKPGSASKDVHVTYARTYLEREGAIDEAAGVLRVPVFGLYADHTNAVTIGVEFPDGALIEREYPVTTGPAPVDPGPGEEPGEEGYDPSHTPRTPPNMAVDVVDPGLGLSFMLIQGHYAPAVIDVDGEVRWQAPPADTLMFPRACLSDGLVVGSLESNDIFKIDWLGRVQTHKLSDPRITRSHHNIEPGKSGLLNTIRFEDGEVLRRLSVLAEMTETGDVTKTWDFDLIFSDLIASHGEDPALMVRNRSNWFHMNSAIYDASDDSIIVSSRENFVLKADYETGAIKWLLGNTAKQWFIDFPKSLQPLALTVLGDPPVGQHALSMSADGQHLMLFNNDAGEVEEPGYSKVSVYRIDPVARTAEEVWTFDFDRGIYSPVSSSAYRTAAGNVIVTFARPDDGSPSRILVVDDARQILFDACLTGIGITAHAYAIEELRLGSMRID